jgi:E3 ubiquitin-protein ligase HERC1
MKDGSWVVVLWNFIYKTSIKVNQLCVVSLQLYTWGFGACLGIAAGETTSLLPQLVEDLAAVRIIDVAIGDSHVLALTHDSEVFAWGNNSMGQCGQGHSTSPITRPRRVLGLEGVPVNQISAGTSHSVFWTALPSDRLVIAASLSVTT